MGTVLLERHSRGVTLTVAGQALQRHAQRILSDVDQLAADLSDYASGIVGVVRLWANTSAVTQFLPRRHLHLRRRESGHPHRTRGRKQQRNRVGGAGRPGRLRHLRRPHARPRTAGVELPRGPAGARRAARHALARRRSMRFEEALEYDFVSLPRGTSLAKRLQAETEALGRRLKLRIQVRSFDAMCQMVAAGMGVAVLPAEAVQPHVRSMNLRQIALKDAWAQATAADRAARRQRRAPTCAPADRPPLRRSGG